MKIQVDLPIEINKALKIYTAQHELKNLQLGIIKILRDSMIETETEKNDKTKQHIQT